MEREELSRMLAAGYSLRATAQVLQRAPSTLSRELARHRTSPATYRAVPAHQRATRWAHQPRKPRKLAADLRLRRAVLARLAQRWSPEQIAHRLRQQYPRDPAMQISHEAIYAYLYGLPPDAFKRTLTRHLRRHHRFRQPRTSPGSRRVLSRRWSALMTDQPKWPRVPCRAIGKATCSSAMPMPRRSELSSNARRGLPYWSR